MVHRIVTADEHARYELDEALTERHHHHLVCSRCGVVLDRKVVLVQPRPFRAFQGWRYMAVKDAPPDVEKAAPGAAAMPEQMRRELRELGLM